MSLKELANRLGLSVSTVSRALNGYADINVETRARTLAVAHELGYRPNSLAKRLAEGHTGTIAVLLPSPEQEFAPPMYLGFLQGVDEALQALGMDALVTMSQDPPDELRPIRRLIETKRVDGVIFGRTRLGDRRIAHLLECGFPFLVFGQCPGAASFPFVDVDRHFAAREAAKLLGTLGHRRIAMLNTPESFVFSQMMRAGFIEGVAQAGLPEDAATCVEAGFTETCGETAAAALLAREDRPSAFACGNDLLAIGCMRAMRTAGLVPGKTGSVVSIEDNQPARLVDPALTAFTVPTLEVGRMAINLLLRSIEGEPPEQLQYLFRPQLVARGTHCRAAQRSLRQDHGSSPSGDD